MAEPITIDLNSDMGESYGRWSLGNDAELMEVITSANIACGWHGGDPAVMRTTVEMAVERGVGIGAHVGLLGGDAHPTVVGQTFEVYPARFRCCATASLGCDVRRRA